MDQNKGETTIMKLNDDCLGEIYKYLNKKDQVSLGLSCQRFKHVFQVYCKLEHSHGNEEGYLVKYLQLAGSLIKSIEIYANTKINGIIGKYCTKIEKLMCLGGSFDSTFINKFKKLKMFKWCRVFDYIGDDDEMLTITAVGGEMDQNKFETTIMQLNDDCLGEIYKYLNKKDQVSLGLSCQRFKHVFQVYCKLEHSHYAAHGNDEGYLVKYLQLAGSLIKSIEFYANTKMNGLIGKYCKNIEKLICLGGSFDSTFINKFQKLKMFEWCRFLDYMSDDEMLTTTAVGGIYALFIRSKWITGKYINRLKNLQVLSLEKCFNLECKYLAEISMKELRILRLKDCWNVIPQCLQQTTKHCTKLIALSFTCNEPMNENHHATYKALLAQLPNLTQLDVYDCTEAFLIALSEHKSDQLVDLKLYYRGYTEHDFRKIITKYQKLKKLAILKCWNYIEDFVQMKYLEEIYLRCCTVSTQCIIDIFMKCPKLVFIEIYCNYDKIHFEILKEWIIEHNRPIELRVIQPLLSTRTN